MTLTLFSVGTSFCCHWSENNVALVNIILNASLQRFDRAVRACKWIAVARENGSSIVFRGLFVKS